MKVTVEQLSDLFGIKKGDVVLCNDRKIHLKTVFDLIYILGEDYQVIKPKHIGDKNCHDDQCKYCPLKCLNCDGENKTLYQVLEDTCADDKELYDFMKLRLDKEI